jgi:uncharacterized protein (DUF736 family)
MMEPWNFSSCCAFLGQATHRPLGENNGSSPISNVFEEVLEPAVPGVSWGQGLRDGRCGAQRSHQGRDGRGLGIATGDHHSSDRHPHPPRRCTIKTLSLNIKARFLPAEPSDNEKAPNLRVMAGNVEIGAAWQRTSKDNAVYHSVKLSTIPPSGRRSMRRSYKQNDVIAVALAAIWRSCVRPLAIMPREDIIGKSLRSRSHRRASPVTNG